MIPPRFADRTAAGRELAGLLSAYGGRADAAVVALPRGGVPVAAEVARVLQTPLDVLVVGRIRMPGDEEWALGAVAAGVEVLNPEALERLGDEARAARLAEPVRREVEQRERAYRGLVAPLDPRDRTILAVDDGLHTGSTMLAAVRALRRRGARRVVVATPVASPAAREALRRAADEVLAVIVPDPLTSIGVWYRDFAAPDDDELVRLLRSAGRPGSPQGR